MQHSMVKSILSAAGLVALLMLTACGGGGGAPAAGQETPAASTVPDAPIADLTGTWTITETGVSDCPAKSTFTRGPYQATIEQLNGHLTVQAFSSSLTGSIAGDNVSWTGSYPEDGGTTTVTSMTLTVDVDGNILTGTAEWTWSDGRVSCAGTSQAINGARVPGTGLVPQAPSGLSASSRSSDRISLLWTDNSDNETVFKIERKLSSGPVSDFALTGLVSANVTSQLQSGLDPDTSYDFRVCAYNANGNSPYSSTFTVRTLPVDAGAPTAPTGLTLTVDSSSSITVRWSDNSGNETGFKIERSTSNINFSEIGTVGSNITVFQNTGLTSATQYFYRVRATNAAGNSAYSSTVSATTQASNVLVAPTGLTAVATASNRIVLFWSDNSDNETGFKIERINASGFFVQIALTPAGSATFSDSSVSPSTRYTYRVRATRVISNIVTNSSYTISASATTPSAPPVQLRVGATTDNLLLVDSQDPSVANTVFATSDNAMGCNWTLNGTSQDFICGVSVLRFDINPLIAGKTISSAVLRLVPTAGATDTNFTLELQAIASMASPPTFNNYLNGRVQVDPIIRRSPPGTIVPVDFDVTAIVQHWANGTFVNNGFVIHNAPADNVSPSGTFSRSIGFHSRESSNTAARPQLVVNF
jgi:hypothetical protein